ncbi:hypothetical protein N9O88_00205 [bacterium]|nr:hypothetical protein [bacterium]
METFQLNNFTFDNIKLSTPQAIQGGGAYFTNLTLDDNPIYLQFPKCKSKSGIISTKKTKYIDLMYKNETTSLIHEWLEGVENKCKNLLDEKKEIWFMNDLTKDDIDSMLTPCSRIYKNGKFILLRMIINNSKKINVTEELQIFDENERKIDEDKLTSENEFIPLVILDGIKFTSRSIEIELKVIQMMILTEIKPEKCFIKKKELENKINISSLEKSDKYLDDEEQLNVNNQEKNKEELDTNKKEQNEQEDEINILENLGENNIINGNIDLDMINNEVLNKNNQQEQDKLTGLNLEPIDLEKVNVGNIEIKKEDIGKKDKNQIEEILEDINFDEINNENEFTLKKPDEIYLEIYKDAKQKAKQMKQAAIAAYLEAKHIKDKYRLFNVDDSSDEEDVKEISEINME